MKLTKFEHSCVLVEDGENIFLTDPGIYAWESGNLNIDSLPQIGTVIVTHKHGDHFAEPFAKALIQKLPDILWVAPSDLHSTLKDFGVKNVTNQTNEIFKVTEGEHDLVEPFGVQVKNLIVDYQDKITITGDTHNYSITNQVLFLAVQAPWGTTINALRLAIKLRPNYILPVHDWMWNQDWKQNVYDRFENVLKENGINFLKPANGQQIEIDL